MTDLEFNKVKAHLRRKERAKELDAIPTIRLTLRVGRTDRVATPYPLENQDKDLLNEIL